MHIFDRDTDFQGLTDHVLKGELTDEWSINGNPNGGYLLAVLLSSMLKHTDKKHPSIVSANYLARTLISETEIDVENISEGKQFNRLQARLLQGGMEKVRAWGTFSQEGICYGDKRYEAGEPKLAPLERCIPIPEFGAYTLYRNMDVRLDPECAGWFEGRLATESVHKGYIKFKDDRPVDALGLVLMADAFPPPVMSTLGPVAWVPTIEFSVNIRAIPKSTWLKAHFRSRFITCGLVEEDGEIWDESGELVLLSRQIAQFRQSA
jgi:acyl-CoA thioesterase